MKVSRNNVNNVAMLNNKPLFGQIQCQYWGPKTYIVVLVHTWIVKCGFYIFILFECEIGIFSLFIFNVKSLPSISKSNSSNSLRFSINKAKMSINYWRKLLLMIDVNESIKQPHFLLRQMNCLTLLCVNMIVWVLNKLIIINFQRLLKSIQSHAFFLIQTLFTLPRINGKLMKHCYL